MRKEIMNIAASVRRNYFAEKAREVYYKLSEQLSHNEGVEKDGMIEIKVQVRVKSVKDIPYLNGALADAGYPPADIRQKLGCFSPVAIATYRFTKDEIAKIQFDSTSTLSTH